MNEGNRYAIHALKDRRATVAGEIGQMKEGIRYREELSHLDAVLRELDPSYKADILFVPQGEQAMTTVSTKSASNQSIKGYAQS
jgi:hypothetical protein